MTGVKVVTDALRAEANKWQDIHDKTETIIRAVDGLDLLETAFWVGEPLEINAKINSKTYNEFQNAVLASYRAAAVEFDQISRVLVKIANEYDRQEKIAELDINLAYTLP